jgi:hypothetical protein
MYFAGGITTGGGISTGGSINLPASANITQQGTNVIRMSDNVNTVINPAVFQGALDHVRERLAPMNFLGEGDSLGEFAERYQTAVISPVAKAATERRQIASRHGDTP